jgi:hypothetical protein
MSSSTSLLLLPHTSVAKLVSAQCLPFCLGEYYVQRNICRDHLTAPIEQGRCPSPYCEINIDATDDDNPVVEIQDADLGISNHFDPAKFTPEKAKEWVQRLVNVS